MLSCYMTLESHQTSDPQINPAKPNQLNRPVYLIPAFAVYQSCKFDFNDEYTVCRTNDILLKLHHIGGKLINSGKAYHEINAGDNLHSLPATESEIATQCTLMESYERLPHCSVTMKRYDFRLVAHHHTANNILHALFVIRIALDHMHPERIYHLYNAACKRSDKMSTEASVMVFADGSGLFSPHACEQLLHRYICINFKRFAEVINEQQKDKILLKKNDPHSFDYIGGQTNKENIHSTLKAATLYQHTQEDAHTDCLNQVSP